MKTNAKRIAELRRIHDQPTTVYTIIQAHTALPGLLDDFDAVQAEIERRRAGGKAMKITPEIIAELRERQERTAPDVDPLARVSLGVCIDLLDDLEETREALREAQDVLEELSDWYVGNSEHEVRLGAAAAFTKRRVRAVLDDQ